MKILSRKNVLVMYLCVYVYAYICFYIIGAQSHVSVAIIISIFSKNFTRRLFGVAHIMFEPASCSFIGQIRLIIGAQGILSGPNTAWHLFLDFIVISLKKEWSKFFRMWRSPVACYEILEMNTYVNGSQTFRCVASWLLLDFSRSSK